MSIGRTKLKNTLAAGAVALAAFFNPAANDNTAQAQEAHSKPTSISLEEQHAKNGEAFYKTKNTAKQDGKNLYFFVSRGQEDSEKISNEHIEAVVSDRLHKKLDWSKHSLEHLPVRFEYAPIQNNGRTNVTIIDTNGQVVTVDTDNDNKEEASFRLMALISDPVLEEAVLRYTASLATGDLGSTSTPSANREPY